MLLARLCFLSATSLLVFRGKHIINSGACLSVSENKLKVKIQFWLGGFTCATSTATTTTVVTTATTTATPTTTTITTSVLTTTYGSSVTLSSTAASHHHQQQK